MARRLGISGRIWAAAIGFAAATHAGAAIFTVTNINDGGAGSFRQAILDANASPGSDGIWFAIPGSGVHTIFALNALPAITESVLINGYSQPGSAWNSDPVGHNAVLQIELLGNGSDGLTITGGSTIVQGLAIYGFQTAIAISGQENNLIQGNFIGTDAAGNPTIGNVYGIFLTAPFGMDRIGDGYPAARNLISGNTTGIVVSGTGGKSIFNNLIGTDRTGTAALPNGTGIELSGCTYTQVGGTPAERNVISGNFSHGVTLADGNLNALLRNFIGTDATGTQDLGNGGDGVRISEQNFLLSRNVISGNAGDGVSEALLGLPDAYPDAIDDNWIGTGADGTSPIGNDGAGVRVRDGMDLRIKGNTIAFNRVGVWRTAPTIYNSCEILDNSMFSNRGLGIVIGGLETVSPNHPHGPWNFPIITSVTPDAGGTRVQGDYSGPANVEVVLQFYRSAACTQVHPDDFVEGREDVGTLAATTDAGGYLGFDLVLSVFLNNEIVTATATCTLTAPPGAGEGFAAPANHTSPFSQRLPFSMTPGSGPSAGSTAITIDGTNFDGAATVTIGGQLAGDVVLMSSQQITAFAPALPAGAAYDLVVTNPGANPSTLRLGWVADFLDVQTSSPFYDFVTKLASNGITGGVGGGNYGVAQSVLRQQMAVFLLKSKHGICYTPAPCTGLFSDVPCPSAFADWIEALAAEGITGGCGTGVYCPQNPVRRDQMAVFLLKAEHGSSYVPPACFPPGAFADVPCPGPFTNWIEQLASEGITSGCGGGNYCPSNPNTRGQMAVFIVKAFDLH